MKISMPILDINGALQGYKRDLYKGGVRVPFMAYWQGQIKAASSSDFIGCSQDFMSTLGEVVGIPTPQQSNGKSILGVIKGKEQAKHEFLNWEFQKPYRQEESFRQSVRIGNLKGVRYGISAVIEFYNLDTNISEANDIAREHPDVVQRMEKIFEEGRSENEHYPYGEYKKEFGLANTQL